MPTPSTSSANSNLSLPLKLDAFVLNRPVCDGPIEAAKISPITQPNYTFLRLTNFIVQNDILNHVDLHNTFPATINPRLTDLGKTPVARRRNREGVYLHWMLPRMYRSGTAATDDAPDNRARDGIQPPTDNIDTSAPQFRLVPSRWLVIRRLHPGTAVPAQSETGIPELQAWVVESDRRSDIKSLPVETDLQVDVSPFVYPKENVSIKQQAEVFIGYREAAEDWDEKKDDGKIGRVPLSLLNGGNILFADYQPHNSNVFSIVDNFSYLDKGGKTLYLEKATASYYVIGWHPDAANDPLYIGNGEQRQTRMDACEITVNDPTTAEAVEWLGQTKSANAVCHAAMYDVEWDVNNKPKTVPADVHSEYLQKNSPVAVGTTPLDSLLTYVQAHQDGGVTDPVVKDIIASIIQIQTLLIEQDDTVDAQQQADDLLYNYNYEVVSGGTRFYLAGSETPGKPAQPPSREMRDDLADLNREQYRRDVTQRMHKRAQWELFALWWKYVCDVDNADKKKKGDYSMQSQEITERLEKLKSISDTIDNKIKGLKDKVPLAKPGVLSSFHEQLDPTLLVGGIQSGWPYDYLKKLKARLDQEITAWKDPTGSNPDIDWSRIREKVIPKLPGEIQATATALIGEFFKLMPERAQNPPEAGTFFPLFHDQGSNPENKPDEPWRDSWGNTQPWFPLFLEWEVEYTHVPFENWTLEERSTLPGETKKLRYGIKDDVNLHEPKESMDDRRTLSGRILLLPQPSFSLEAKINQLFSSTPTDLLEGILPEAKRKQLQENLYRLAFLSSPLAGLHDHLRTMVQGTHIKPTIRQAGEGLRAIEDAIDKDAGFTKTQFEYIGTETDLTPYGTLVQFYKSKYSAFKPVTHGQFKFRKLNIIDKFGQAIHAIDPRWSTTAPPALYPCISEFYAPQSIGDTKTANTVDSNPEGLCEFAQMGPHINQLTRLNAVFVKRSPDLTSWVPQTEWENPIWGWIVINYAEYGLQFFLQDGTFYREIRVGGRSGATTSDKWLPFSRPENVPDTSQLDHLLTKLAEPNTNNLQDFVDMINGALMKSPPAPDAYAQFLNSVVGKPLALVNMGWSLEMATDSYVNQSTLNRSPLARSLLEDPEYPGQPLYEFKIKLGDKERSYDGLVGYFDTLDTQDHGNDLKLSKLFTFFPSKKPSSSLLTIISKDNYPTFKPFFITPDDYEADTIETIRNSALSTFGAIVDPFNPVHAYSGILPIQPLSLPTWTWQDALSRMTAFFHMGPLVVTQDVPEFVKEYELKGDYKLKDLKTIPGSAVGVPAMASADWNWLQPYMVPGEGQDGRVYAPLALGGTDERPKFEPAPYTTIEGYLQLKQAIVRAE